jgi:1-phosphofructokinase
VLTVTIEPGGEHGAEIHYHPGGQGVWVARMAAELGARVVLCVVLAGEAGDVLDGLLRFEGVEVRAVRGHGRSGSYIHDRRSGERVPVAVTEGPRLWRHETDGLYGAMLTAGLEADLAMLTGPQPPGAVAADFYRRLAMDLRGNGARVVADLTYGALEGALAGGVDVLKISHVEMVKAGFAADERLESLIAGAHALRDAGALAVVVSRAAEPAILLEDDVCVLRGSRFEANDAAGAGDSMFAAIGVALASGRELIDAVGFGMAAGSLNVTRRGLGTGARAEIEQLAARVRAEEPSAGGRSLTPD